MSRRRMRTPPPYVDTRAPIMSRPSRSHHDPYDDYHSAASMHHHHRDPYSSASRMPPQRAHPLPPPPPATYKILCVTNLNYKVSDGNIRDALLNEFNRYGDISVRVCHDGSERLAYVYFRCYEEAREARHDKSRLLLFDRLVEIDPIYEHRSSSINAPLSGPYSSSRRRSNTPPEYLGGGGGMPSGPRRSSPPPMVAGHSSRSSRSSMVAPPPPPPRGIRSGPLSPYERHSSYGSTHSPYDSSRSSSSQYHNHSGSAYRDRDRSREPPYGHDPYGMTRSPRYSSDSYAHHPASSDGRVPAAYGGSLGPIGAPSSSSSSSHRGSSSVSGAPPPPPHSSSALSASAVSASSASSSSVSHQHHHTPPSSSSGNAATNAIHHSPSSTSAQRASGNSIGSNGGSGSSSSGAAIGSKLDARKEKFPNYLHHIAPEDDEKATRTLFIGNLEVSISDSELRRLFERYGHVEDVDVKRPPPNQGNAYAFIRFANLDQAHKAKVEVSGQYIGKFQCKIGYGKATPTRRLWVGGLGQYVSQQHLEQEFERFGTIAKIEYNKDDDFAYIEYETLDAAQAASQDMRGHQIAGSEKRLRIDYADTEDEPSGMTQQQQQQHQQQHQLQQQHHQQQHQQMSPEFASARIAAGSESDEIRTIDDEGIDEDGVTISDSVTSISELAKCCPVSWNAALVLKNSVFTSRMFLCSGDIALVDKYITESDTSDTLPTLKISQRLRLDPPKLDDVTRRMNADGIKNYSMFLILDCPQPPAPAPVPPPSSNQLPSTPTTTTSSSSGHQGCSPATPSQPAPATPAATSPPGTDSDILANSSAPGQGGDTLNHNNSNNNNDTTLSNNNVGNATSAAANGDALGCKASIVDNQDASCSKPLKNLIAYLRQKDAAGVVAFKDTDGKQLDVYMYAFPPCPYAIDLVRQAAPNLTTDPVQAQKDNFLVGLIVKGK